VTHTDRIRLVSDAVVSSYVNDISARASRARRAPAAQHSRPEPRTTARTRSSRPRLRRAPQVLLPA
jgi:hypothetical protein